MGYSMIEGKLVQVAYPADAVELMELIQKANDEGKKFYLNAGKGEIRIDSGLSVPANLREVFENMATELDSLRRSNSGSGRQRKPRADNSTPEQRELESRYNAIKAKVTAGEKPTADEVKFVKDAHAKKLAWKPRGRRSPVMDKIAG